MRTRYSLASTISDVIMWCDAYDVKGLCRLRKMFGLNVGKGRDGLCAKNHVSVGTLERTAMSLSASTSWVECSLVWWPILFFGILVFCDCMTWWHSSLTPIHCSDCLKINSTRLVVKPCFTIVGMSFLFSLFNMKENSFKVEDH